jgi:hypothetical protein
MACMPVEHKMRHLDRYHQSGYNNVIVTCTVEVAVCSGSLFPPLTAVSSTKMQKLVRFELHGNWWEDDWASTRWSARPGVHQTIPGRSRPGH